MPKNAPLTTTPVVEAISRIKFTGNILPDVWFQRIQLPSGHPDTIGCILLSEIVYWYRHQEVKNEETGQLIGYHKRFKADKLQRSSQAFADKFGFTKRQVIDAINRLEQAGYITKELRKTRAKDGTTRVNVCFVEPVPAMIAQVSAPAIEETGDDASSESIEHVRSTADPLRFTADPPTPERTLQEISTRDYDKDSTYVEGAAAPDVQDQPKVEVKKKGQNPDGTYGDPQIASVLAYLKEKMGIGKLDGGPMKNQFVVQRLLKARSDDPRPAMDRIKELIDAAASDPWYAERATNMRFIESYQQRLLNIAKKKSTTSSTAPLIEIPDLPEGAIRLPGGGIDFTGYEERLRREEQGL